MVIILIDEDTGRQVKAVGHDQDYIIYRKAEGVEVDGKIMTKNGKELKNDWTFAGLYPSSIPSAVYHCLNLLLANPDDSDDVVVEAVKAEKSLNKIIKAKLDKLVLDAEAMYAEAYKEGYDNGYLVGSEAVK